MVLSSRVVGLADLVGLGLRYRLRLLLGLVGLALGLGSGLALNKYRCEQDTLTKGLPSLLFLPSFPSFLFPLPFLFLPFPFPLTRLRGLESA